MPGPVIVCGLGRVGRRVLDHIRAAQLSAVVIDSNLDSTSLPEGVRGIKGDCRQSAVLLEAGIVDARGVIVCTSDDLANITTALAARRLNADIRIVVRVFNENLLPRLGKAVRNTFALSVSALSAPLIALTALTGDVLGTFRLADSPRQIAAVTVTSDSPLVGRTVADVADYGRAIPLALLPGAGPEKLLLDLPKDARLAPGDRLVVCGEPRNIGRLLGYDDDAVLGVRWAGWLRRYGRTMWRTVREIDKPVLVCTLVLVAVVLTSTLTFRMTGGEPWGVALRETVGVIATAGALPPSVDHPGLQVFVSLLRLAGAALTALFTAIITQYLLRARLGGALEIRRIPDGGHVVVCGLGNIGFRVVEELLSAGEQVVVIETDRNNRFLASARRLGAAVVPGDATVPEVLRQARAGAARAVVVATSAELANVEIALLARELNSTQRVVVRLSDADLADTLRQAADIRLALSVPALAAPAFVAALFGDRVRCAIRVGPRMLMVVEVAVPEGDACLDGQTGRAVAVDFNLLPLAIVGRDGGTGPRPLETRLAAGDRLTAVAALPDLERLFRRERGPAEWAVEVTGFPLPARGQVALLARTRLGVSAIDAEKRLANLPFTIDCGLTRGQAEDLLELLQRERIDSRIAREG
jgi:Trk K+ transport system NAD-binding subunit